jgi:hypothetical protein
MALDVIVSFSQWLMYVSMAFYWFFFSWHEQQVGHSTGISTPAFWSTYLRATCPPGPEPGLSQRVVSECFLPSTVYVFLLQLDMSDSFVESLLGQMGFTSLPEDFS